MDIFKENHDTQAMGTSSQSTNQIPQNNYHQVYSQQPSERHDINSYPNNQNHSSYPSQQMNEQASHSEQNHYSQSEQYNIESNHSEIDLPQDKQEDNNPQNTVWDIFQHKLENKNEYMKPKDYPRKPMMIDADLCSTLREIEIEKISTTNLLNIILRSFIEGNIDELRQFRKPQAPSVF